MFSLSVDSLKIGILSFALLLESSVFCLGFLVIGSGVDTHNSNLLFSLNGKLLGCGFSFIS
jgi:hypothetical protein